MKKNISTLILSFCLTVISFSVLAQDGNQAKLTSFEISLDSSNIMQGDTIQLSAMQFYSDGHLPINVTEYCNWVISQPGIVKISESGKLISIGYGTVSITAEIGTGKNATKSTAKSIVVSPSFTNIRIDAPDGTDIPMRGSIYFRLLGVDIYGSDIDLSDSATWSTNNNCAKINSEGQAKGKSSGFCEIKVKYKDIAVAPLQVQVMPDSDIIYLRTKIEYGFYPGRIGTGESIRLSAFLGRNRDTISNLHIKWFSSNSDIASVDSTGKVSGNLLGDVVIHALVDNYLSGHYSFRVVSNVTGVKVPTVNQPVFVDGNIQMIGLKQHSLGQWEYNSTESWHNNFQWKSLDTSIAKINQEGLVTGKSKGIAKIVFMERSRLKRELFTDTVDVLVVGMPNLYDINLRRDSIVKGNSKQLKAKAYTISRLGKEDYQLKKEKIEWFSMNDRIATVNSEGLVTAVGEGTAFIRYSYDGVLSRPCIIYVTTKP
jgi:hypothetical protein